MAILANRAKNSNRSIEFVKFILIFFKRFFVLLFIVASLYLFISTPKRLSSISLEVVGYFISGGLVIYEGTFKQINLITQKFIYLQDLARENLKLQFEIEKLKRLQNDIHAIEAENIALKKLLLVVEKEQYSCVTAKLLSVSLNPFSKTILVTAGINHGIEVDQIVTNSEGLVGRVIEVSANYSKIILVNDVNSRIPVTTLLSREKAILTGNGDSSELLYLPNNHLIQEGEKVITSGYGSIYPSGITVGYVSKIREKKVVVKPVVDLSKTEFVSILLPNNIVE